ncbi:hypothetical protein BJ878DRAFT_485783 [Calycina marina]|uniref:Uncharacterized protein n=1 Tax=Calycina marina TaxID=1763456 RepID=A0A9P7ZC77_9HELO|nr:hypothetical protein BJ878DRAFT_485783 [Calycina marina]
MASQRNFTGNSGLKLTPGNSPFARTPRPPNKARPGLYEGGLSLRRIIGTTVSSPTAFDSISTSRQFAYCAGAAAVVVNMGDEADLEGSAYTQRFFRARPTAVASNTTGSSVGASSTPTANDGRSRIGNLKDAAIAYSPATPHTSLDQGGDSTSLKTWTSRERIKAATCLSMSKDGRYLAVGETGYAPRVLIFSLQDASSDIPLAILNEHTFGVRAVSWSPDGKYLASLGDPNDGYLYVWSINQRSGAAKLHSSNKCTASVKQMIWLGNSIVTVGTRHIKIWKVEDPRSSSPIKQRFAIDGTPQPIPAHAAPKTLTGRNVLLGPLVDATFSAICAISDRKAVVCSEKGEVCLLEDSEGQRLLRLTNVGFSVTCVAVDPQAIMARIGGKCRQIKAMPLNYLLAPTTPPESPVPVLNVSTATEAGHYCAMGYASHTLITVDSRHMIEMSSSDSDVEDPVMLKTPFPASGDAVKGVTLLNDPNHLEAAFLTWCTDGTIAFWDLVGKGRGLLKVEVEQQASSDEDVVNQLQIVRASKGAKYLVTGDRYGVLRILDPASGSCRFDVRAHSSDINDIAILEGGQYDLVASCGRDRIVQLFRYGAGQWELIQTLDDHAASVGGLCFVEMGEKLVSFSTDRTIHIRQLVKKDIDGAQLLLGAVPLRIITLKATPVSMVPCLDSKFNIVVSQLDRTIATYDFSSGRLVSSFKAADSDGSEAVVLDALRIGMPGLPGRPTILAGVSGTDKSVRVYDADAGSFLDREWGHTTAITDVALLESSNTDQKTLISTGSDGTIMIWDLSSRTPDMQDLIEITPTSTPQKATTSARPPLRKVLSRAEIAEFQRASPITTPTGRASPPRAIIRKASRYGLSMQSPAAVPLVPLKTAKHFASTSEDSISRKGSPRYRSPPASPNRKESRRPSLAESRMRRPKSSGSLHSEFGSLNSATEKISRSLRAYRKKLLTCESIEDEALRELEQELRLTAVALGERSVNSKRISETELTGLLDQYSSRLVSMFDEKLRLTRSGSSGSAVETAEQPKTAETSTATATDNL